MKTLLLLIALLPLSLSARECEFAWDPNPAAEQVTSYRLERLDASGQWVSIGTVPGDKTSLVVPAFPDITTSIRAFATNAAGDSDPSEVLVVPAQPGQPKGLRLVIKLSGVVDITPLNP